MAKMLDVFRPPFSHDKHFVYTDDGMACLMCVNSSNPEELTEKLCDILNDESKPTRKNEYSFIYPEIRCLGRALFVVRGLTVMTDMRGMGLDVNEAMKLQESFAQWVITKLTAL